MTRHPEAVAQRRRPQGQPFYWAEVGPGQVATWGVVKQDKTIGFDWSHPHPGGSSMHFPFDWRPKSE